MTASIQLEHISSANDSPPPSSTLLLLLPTCLFISLIAYIFDPAIKAYNSAQETEVIQEEDLDTNFEVKSGSASILTSSPTSSTGSQQQQLQQQKEHSYHHHLLSIIIPAYNEEERLPLMLDATLEHLIKERNTVVQLCHEALHPGMQTRTLTTSNEITSNHNQQQHQWYGDSFEIIIVNDGSNDRTASIIKDYVHKRIIAKKTIVQYEFLSLRLFTLKRNCGKGFAVRTGMIRSNGKLCLMVDADGATDFQSGIRNVLTEMARLSSSSSSLEQKIVFGSRAHLQNDSTCTRSAVRTLLMYCFHFFVKTLCSHKIRDTQCGFKLFTKNAAIALFTNLHLCRWAFDTELVVMAEHLRIPMAEVAVTWREVDGSKLDTSKFALAMASMGMLRDMICVRACYTIGIWKIKE